MLKVKTILLNAIKAAKGMTVTGKVIAGVSTLAVLGGTTAGIVAYNNATDTKPEVEYSDTVLANDEKAEEVKEESPEDIELAEIEEAVENGKISEEEFNEKIGKLEQSGNADDTKLSIVKSKAKVKGFKQPNKSQEPSNESGSNNNNNNNNRNSNPSTSSNNGSNGGNATNNSTPNQPSKPSQPSAPSQPSKPSYPSAGIDWNLTNEINAEYSDVNTMNNDRDRRQQAAIENYAKNGTSVASVCEVYEEGVNTISIDGAGSNSGTIKYSSSNTVDTYACSVSYPNQPRSHYYFIIKHDGNGNVITTLYYIKCHGVY